uniref:DUF5683 domain-containing protein n=1 Tax=Heterorhabditis bacteriophora TaxID=37862 RepID=A0A1I7WU76_HETBA
MSIETTWSGPTVATILHSNESSNPPVFFFATALINMFIFVLIGEKSDGYLAIDYHNQAIIASFSSVAAGNQLLYNRFNAEFFTNRQVQFEGSDGLVNRFIYDSWFNLWYILGIESALKKLFNFYTNYELWVSN